jgi:hypothetical protein
VLCGLWIAATFAYVADNVRNAEHAAMRRVVWREPARRAEGAPYRHLAVRVIDQAFRDLAIPTGSAAGQESAREFLAGNSMLYHWCAVADLNPVWLVARARRLMAASADLSPGRGSWRAITCANGVTHK